MTITIIIIYLVGAVISFGSSVWFTRQHELKHVKFLQPSYRKAVHDPYSWFAGIISWIGVIIMWKMSYDRFKDAGVTFSYKKLWDTYHKNHFE